MCVMSRSSGSVFPRSPGPTRASTSRSGTSAADCNRALISVWNKEYTDWIDVQQLGDVPDKARIKLRVQTVNGEVNYVHGQMSGSWQQDENERFERGWELHGEPSDLHGDLSVFSVLLCKKIAEVVGTRSFHQVKSHSGSWLKKQRHGPAAEEATGGRGLRPKRKRAYSGAAQQKEDLLQQKEDLSRQLEAAHAQQAALTANLAKDTMSGMMAQQSLHARHAHEASQSQMEQQHQAMQRTLAAMQQPWPPPMQGQPEMQQYAPPPLPVAEATYQQFVYLLEYYSPKYQLFQAKQIRGDGLGRRAGRRGTDG